ncbi:hypothetical protein PUR61_13890 [Streptomyces sp. BE20]|uniref:hypothetical protein n=1 Tax=Streptomyces sp. BE20 TaxID=3002525 RepID=UPI002E78EBB1|nr:hypothetical protein [Streptomyces sp. BE20]MEE1823272.1 hypothetical protein [Streptomyces sp. BE20]
MSRKKAKKAFACCICGTSTADGKVVGIMDRVSGPAYVRWACRAPCAPQQSR